MDKKDYLIQAKEILLYGEGEKEYLKRVNKQMKCYQKGDGKKKNIQQANEMLLSVGW